MLKVNTKAICEVYPKLAIKTSDDSKDFNVSLFFGFENILNVVLVFLLSLKPPFQIFTFGCTYYTCYTSCCIKYDRTEIQFRNFGAKYGEF